MKPTNGKPIDPMRATTPETGLPIQDPNMMPSVQLKAWFMPVVRAIALTALCAMSFAWLFCGSGDMTVHVKLEIVGDAAELKLK